MYIFNPLCTYLRSFILSCCIAADCVEWDVRLMVDDFYTADIPDATNYLYSKNDLTVGRVEVCREGKYRPICAGEYWNNASVSVVCYQLGFSPYGTYTSMNETSTMQL